MTARLHFGAGLLGMPHCRTFDLSERHPFYWMQAAFEDTALALADPFAFVADYEFPLSEAEKELIQLSPTDTYRVLAVLNVVDGVLVANLKGPLVINARTSRGVQVVLSGEKYALRHPIATRNGVPPASVPQDATEGVRVWECPWKCHQILNVGGSKGLWFHRQKPDGPFDWTPWSPIGEYDTTELVGGQEWVALHGPALAAALSPSVKEYPDV